MAHEESALVRISTVEAHLLTNFRKVNPVRQDTLLFFSDELVKLEAQDTPASSNVVRLESRK